MIKTALTIAGSDPSGGAGIQADLKTFSAYGVYGMAVPAALTAQNTQGVTAVKTIAPKFMREQLSAVLVDMQVDAVKTGMLLSARTIEIVAEAIKGHQLKNLVVDPVMVSSTGKRLLRKDAAFSLISLIFPLAELVTPNIDEAEVISGVRIETPDDIEEAARIIHGLGPRFVLIKGGHRRGDPIDLFYNGREFFEYKAKRVENRKLHGTGCVYSAAITAGLAKGMSVMESIASAKEFITKAIKKAAPVGKGRVPLL